MQSTMTKEQHTQAAKFHSAEADKYRTAVEVGSDENRLFHYHVTQFQKHWKASKGYAVNWG